MNKSSLSAFAVICTISLLFPTQCLSTGMTPFGIFHWGKKGVMAGVANSVAIGKGVGAGVAKTVGPAVALPALGAKALGAKTLLMAPIAIPLALGGKALLAAKLAVPITVGAAIGAPVGALIGAKAGAIKGALVGKAMIAAKIGLAKKVAVKGAALAAAPVVFAAKTKAKIAGIGLGLLAKKAIGIGALATKAGASMKAVSAKLKEFPQNLISQVTIPTVQLPQLSLPSLPMKTSKKGPTSIEYSLIVNGPHTGYKSKKTSFYSSNRRRRDAEAEAEAEAVVDPQATNAQQLLQLVRSQNAQQCLQKVICELSANPNSHGQEGIRFGRSLLMLEAQTDKPSAAQYRQAATTGAQLTSEVQCQQFFPSCAFESQEIVRIGNQMIEG